MIFGVDTNTLIESIGLVGIAAIIFFESGVVFGFFLPGDTILFAAGILSASGHFPIALVILAAFFAAIAGVTFGYFTGKHLGARWLKKERRILLKQDYVDKATQFYDRYGALAVILCRFIPAARSFVPFIAGIVRMPYGKLMLYNIIGGSVWAIGIPLTGFFSGKWLSDHGISVEALVVPVIVIVIVASLAAPFIHALINRKTRKAAIERLKRFAKH